MKYAIAIAAAWFTVVTQAVPNCIPGQVAHASRSLSREASRFERTLSSAAGYAHLANDAYRLQRDADHLAFTAQGTASCEHIEHDFRNVRDTFQFLKRDLQSVQQHAPNTHVQYQWESVARDFRAVRDAVQGHSGGGGTIQTTVTCQSHNYQYQACHVNGRVITARVAQQLSSAGCNEGSSWGLLQNGIWVNRGCRANFLVTIRTR